VRTYRAYAGSLEGRPCSLFRWLAAGFGGVGRERSASER
jgi:hypothetical protein